jgi:hypothetical protein
MQFIEVDQAAFQCIGSKAIFESLNEEMKLIYEQIIELD